MKGNKSGEEMETEILIDSDASQDNFKGKSANKKQKNQKGKKPHLDSESGKDEQDDMISGITKGVKKMEVNKAKNKNKNKSKNKQGAILSDESADDVVADDMQISKGKGKKAKKNAFDALLMDDIDDDDDDDNDNDNDNDNKDAAVQSEEDEEPVKKKNNNAATGGKKGKKNKRKDRHDDEEDLDQVLAELQAEYAGEVITAAVPVPNKKKSNKSLTATAAAGGSIDEDDNKNNDDAEDIDGGSTVKSAAQKKREKKERQKREAALAKQRGPIISQDPVDLPIDKTGPTTKAANIEEIQVPTINEKANNDDENTAITGDDAKGKSVNKKKTKKDKKAELEANEAEAAAKKDTKKKGMSAAMVAAMQERLKQVKEEEERLQREEEERMRLEDERERQRLEALRLEAEKKEKRKQKEAERKARLKAEGKLLTKKQKEERVRAQAMLDALKAQGLELPDPAERRAARPGTRIRPKKKTTDKKDESADSAEHQQDVNSLLAGGGRSGEEKPAVEPKIKESWDASDTEEEANGEDEETQTTSTNSDEHHHHHHHQKTGGKHDDHDEAGGEADDSNDDDDGGDDSDSDTETDSDSVELEKDQAIKFNPNDPEAVRLRAEQRISNRQNDAEKKRTLDNLRAAVVCVLGHVDTGKTKILDKLRRTHVQDSEAGGITQQIGATNVPIDAIKEQSKVVREAVDFEYKLPGLLIIDTPGHESFSNLRNRGSSLCDIAILVVDIMHGLEPQTIESINMLKKKKCPFIVALNKIDRLYDWKVMARRDVRDVLKEQQANTQMEFNTRAKEVIVQLAEQGLNAAMFYENPDPKTYISLIPTSAITGEGMGNLLFMIIEFCQRMLPKRLMYSEELQATVLEVKAIPGLGTTIDAILINGRLREGETMILAGTDGPIVTQIRSLLMPQPLKELRVKNAYVEYKEIQAAQGVKIAAKDLEKAIAGINLLIAHKPDEVEICKEEIVRELKSALSHIKLAQTGVYVQASTLGSLEALLEFLRTSKIPYSAIRIGPVVKRDVMKASTMLEHEAQYATILAFDVKVEREAQEMADALGVKVFQADIIYHLFDKFTAYREELRQKKREEFRSIAVFPCKLKILPQFVFNSRDPIIMGVIVENGIVKVGTPICVPSKEFVDIGIVTSIESNHKQLDSARKGLEVCIKIDPIPGESPKMFGRHFEADDMLVSKISRQSIDACKDYFRDDLIKADWSLMVELKKLFEIM